MTISRVKLKGLTRPTMDTKFHIDYDWWTRQERDLQVYLRSLCKTYGVAFEDDADANKMVDWVDMEAAEVQQVNMAHYKVLTYCARQPDYITPNTSLVEAVFRLFLANGNRPLTVPELLAELNRVGQESTLLRMLSSPRVYRGLRPMY